MMRILNLVRPVFARYHNLMSTAVSVPENRVTLTNVSWAQYLAVLGEHEHDGRVAYYQGILEIMTVGFEHESIKRLISRLIDHYALARDVDIHPGGNFTMKREEFQSGIEADDCFYIQSIAKLRSLQEISLPEDPPPDLAIEVDITNPSIDKLAIYAAIGVPEIWRYRDETVDVLLLQVDGSYVSSPTSACLPDFPIPALDEALEGLRGGKSSNVLVKDFAKWIGRIG